MLYNRIDFVEFCSNYVYDINVKDYLSVKKFYFLSFRLEFVYYVGKNEFVFIIGVF